MLRIFPYLCIEGAWLIENWIIRFGTCRILAIVYSLLRIMYIDFDRHSAIGLKQLISPSRSVLERLLGMVFTWPFNR